MKKIERYRQKLAELESRRNRLMRQGKYMQMQKLDVDIQSIRKMVDEAEKYEARPIRELLSMDEIHESGIIPIIMECHLAADYLTDCAYRLSDTIKKMGFNPVSLVPDMEEIISRSSAFAAILCQKDALLSDMLTNNETLIDALRKKTMHYIRQRTAPKTRGKSRKSKETDNDDSD